MFIGGPSGVGKEYVSKYLAKANRWEWIELDTPGRDAVDDLDLRTEWGALWHAKPAQLFAEVKRRAIASGNIGAIVSIPGNCLFPEPVNAAIVQEGGVWVVLWGARSQCCNAFLVREKETGRGLDEDHWKRHNEGVYKIAEAKGIAGNFVDTFEKNGKRRPVEEVCAEIGKLVGRMGKGR